MPSGSDEVEVVEVGKTTFWKTPEGCECLVLQHLVSAVLTPQVPLLHLRQKGPNNAHATPRHWGDLGVINQGSILSIARKSKLMGARHTVWLLVERISCNEHQSQSTVERV